MIAAVVDTNVLVSGYVRSNPNAAPSQILTAWYARQFILVISQPLLAEVERTLTKPYCTKRLSQELIATDVAALRGRATFTDLTASVSGVATHPEDDLILATAVSARADYLVTGDGKLQQLGSYEGVTILSPRAFLDLLRAEQVAAEQMN